MTLERQKRLMTLTGAAAVAAAIAGLVAGSGPPAKPDRPAHAISDSPVDRAFSYADLRNQRRGPNAGMYDGAFAWLRSRGPALTDEVEQSEEDRARSLREREERRAYAGAPPVVPHPIQEREAAACLSCHDGGSRLAGLRAPAMSHEKYTMCVQCHAPQREEEESVKRLGDVGGDNHFVGLNEPGPGETAWQGAPPVIPHPTFMREACNSCHGPNGAQGLRTPHPVRASCSQCHAHAAPFDQSAPPALPPGGAP